MEFIPLGSSCSVAYQLQQLNVRQCAYPFDWLRVELLDNITNVLKNNFDEFVTSCQETSVSNNFPISTDDQFPNSNDKTQNSIIMKNKYEMKFYHDFNDKTSLKEVDEKYKRRIERFYKIIKETNKVCFIRDELKTNKITDCMIREFIEEIKKINPLIQVKIIIIIHNPKNQIIKLNSDDRITIINDTKEFGDWIRPNVDWKNLITELNYFIKS